MKNLIVDYRISCEEESTLKSLNYNIIKCPKCSSVSGTIDGHPDIQLNILKNNIIIAQNQIPTDFISLLQNLNYRVILTKNSLKIDYPDDIILNAVFTRTLLFHNLRYTDENLLDNLKANCNKYYQNELTLVNVKQGYTKCSTAVLGEEAFITSDKGIAKALALYGMDVLLLPAGDIMLPGMNYGFIGGCCGLIEDKVMAFYGDLKEYAFGDQVKQFLKSHKIEYVSLSRGKLIDRGSIFRI